MYAIPESHLVIIQTSEVQVNAMELHFVYFLLILACDGVAPVPVPQLPQQNGNIGATPFGPFSVLYDLATLFPSSVLTTSSNVMGPIPFLNMIPAAFASGIQMGENVAENMDARLSAITGNSGAPNLPQPFGDQRNFGQIGSQLQPFDGQRNYGPIGTQPQPFGDQQKYGQIGDWQSNGMNTQSMGVKPAIPAYKSSYQLNSKASLPIFKPNIPKIPNTPDTPNIQPLKTMPDVNTENQQNEEHLDDHKGM